MTLKPANFGDSMDMAYMEPQPPDMSWTYGVSGQCVEEGGGFIGTSRGRFEKGKGRRVIAKGEGWRVVNMHGDVMKEKEGGYDVVRTRVCEK
jgi:hypothetical protein